MTGRRTVDRRVLTAALSPFFCLTITCARGLPWNCGGAVGPYGGGGWWVVRPNATPTEKKKF